MKMKLLPLLFSSIVVCGVLIILTSADDAPETPQIDNEVTDIEDKVAEVMDELEVLEDKLEPAQQDDKQENKQNDEIEAKETDSEKKSDDGKTDTEESSEKGEVKLIDEAKDNKFTLLSLFHGRYYENYYQKINNYLVDRLEDNDNTQDNMKLALNWLNALESSSFHDPILVRALKQFTSLTKIGGENMCSKNSYGILRKNDLATRGRGHRRLNKLGAMRRVDKIVYEFSIQHAIDCFREYPRKFFEKRAQLDQIQLGYTENLIDQLFQTILKPRSLMGISIGSSVSGNLDPRRLVRDITSLDRADVGESTLQKLRLYSEDDPDHKYLEYVNDDRSGTYIIRDDKIQGLYEKYIVRPCEYYIEQLGFDILIPMRFDLQVLEPEDRFLMDNDRLVEFYYGYARFRACNLLIYQDRKALARHVVKAAHKMAQPKN